MLTPSGTHYNCGPPFLRCINGTVRWSWPTVGAYVSVYLACLGVFVTGISSTALTLFTIGFLARMWLLTVGFHRYFAHRSFSTSRMAQFVLALLGSMSLQGGVLWWAETHRRHHRAADTPTDLHSPHHQGFFYAHYGWFLDTRHRGTRLRAIAD